jgi:hypothetical protein
VSGRDGDYRVIDLHAKRTEADWGKANQAAVERATDAWFAWLRWILTTGAFAYLAKVTHDIWLILIEYVCLVVLYVYFLNFFASLRIEPLTTRWVSANSFANKVRLIVLSALVLLPVYGVRAVIMHVVDIFETHHP